jgi:hypothetical protein
MPDIIPTPTMPEIPGSPVDPRDIPGTQPIVPDVPITSKAKPPKPTRALPWALLILLWAAFAKPARRRRRK